ncbi:glycoside hydrolase family 2 protein [Actinophytocola sp.]|uniref:glycoside hydrolase family 2 protein n=1 Tax=Actinophytocola sp. TaxID=1872138 RepID=UPI002D24EE7C|nr:sugar-binding domain-containing protein [Actinophytocola sp.]HYQ62227.1 glycoside hydrolase family 2 TIM barrel-domain containing protein [Actinophytocola sp.]
MHPRPQLTREQWQDLCGDWEFAHDDEDTGLLAGWWRGDEPFDRVITVPFPPESSASGVHDPAPHPIVWYRRTFTAPAGERLLLHFGAVDYRARVWVNGTEVAAHVGGHAPFQVDITHALAAGEQILVVRAEDRVDDLTQPRGKQYWEPTPDVIWYHRTTGIWQPVWLEPVPATHLAELTWFPSAATNSVTVRAGIAGRADDLSLRVRLTTGDRVLADDRYRVDGPELTRTITLPRGDFRWSPGDPRLIDAELSLVRGGETVDETRSYFGLRDVGVKDGRFILNGERMFLRLVLAQGYWPSSHLAAPSEDALRREVELIRELGFNGVRVHQKVEDPRFLYWCDRLGLVMWGEMANAYEYSVNGVARFTAEWLEVVRRDVSHPCVVTWVPVNESWGTPALWADPRQRHFLESVYHLTHAVDGTRPVISNDGWEMATSDIWTVHDYSPSAEDLTSRYGTAKAVEAALGRDWPGVRRVHLGDPVRGDQPLMVTEFGGLSYTPEAGERWFGYRTVANAEDLLAAYERLVTALVGSDQVAGYCYTQLTDTEQEVNGLLTESREPKVDPAEIRRINTLPAASVPTERLAQLVEQARQRSRGE